MSVVRIVLVILAATVLASFSDWLFTDALIHRFYQVHPATWRPGSGPRRIVGSQIVGTLATAAAVLLCLWVPGRPIAVALAAWCAGPLPMAVQQWQWMQVHPAITASHAVGWLVRLLIACLLAAWFLV